MRTYLKRSYLLGLFCLLCGASAALAQYPAVSPEPGSPQLYSTQPSGVTSLPGVPKVEINPPYTPNPAPHSGGVVVAGPLGVQPHEHHPKDMQCVRTPSVDKKVKVYYGSVTIDYCLPKCGLHGCNGDCNDGHGGCGHPRQKHFLLKRVVVTECPAYDCTPVCKEHPGSCPAPGIPYGTPMPTYQPAPPAMPGQPLPPPTPGYGTSAGAMLPSAPQPGTPLMSNASVPTYGTPMQVAQPLPAASRH
jgi:hypothetical protein